MQKNIAQIWVHKRRSIGLPNKSTVLETQLLRFAFISQLNPMLPLVALYPAIKQDAEYARNKPDHDVVIMAEVRVHNTEKLLKHANVNCVSELDARPIVYIFFGFFYLPSGELFILSFRVIVCFSFSIHHLQAQIYKGYARKTNLRMVDKMSTDVQQRMCF